MRKSWKLDPIFSNFLKKFIRKWPQIDESASLERFRRQIAPRLAPGRFPEFGVVAFSWFLEILFGNMGPFSAPWEIADRSKIALLRDDWDFDPRKMPSWRGFGKNMKFAWKIDAKIEGFWWLRTTFGVILFAYFTLSHFLKKIEKSMPKGRPKVELFDEKTVIGR